MHIPQALSLDQNNVTLCLTNSKIGPNEITVITDFPDFYRVQDHGRLTAEHISKHSCVCGAAWHAENPPVCRSKTSPCVGSKRLCVYQQNVRMLNTCARFAGTHGGVLNLHTGTS